MAEHDGDLLPGARQIGRYLFGDDEHEREIYELRHVLPLFKLKGVWHGRKRTLDAALAEHERASSAARGTGKNV
jgi:hypothetical protein